MSSGNTFYDAPIGGEGRARSTSNQSIDLSNAPIQLPDWTENRANCAQCDRGFTMVRRKHHCRLCGDTFCGECSRGRRTLSSYGIIEAARVCDPCADLVDTADQKGLTSIAIQLSQGSITGTGLGSLDRMIRTEADTGSAAVAVGCVDALLKAALNAGSDARKLDTIMTSLASMCRHSDAVSARVESQEEWVGAAQSALSAAAQSGQSGAGALSLLGSLAGRKGASSLSQALVDQHGPWPEILRSMPPIMSTKNGPGKEEALALLDWVFPAARNVPLVPASSFLSSRGIAALFAVLQDRSIMSNPGTTTCGLRLLVTLLDSCDRADVSASAGNFGEALDNAQGFGTVVKGLQSPVTQIRFLSTRLLLHIMLKSPNTVAAHSAQFNGLAAIASVLQRGAVNTEEAAIATASSRPTRGAGMESSFPFQSALTEMGFAEFKARKAVQATNGAGVEQAANWLFEHSDAPDAFFLPEGADDESDDEPDDPAPQPELTNTHLLVLAVLARLLDQGLGFELVEAGAADAAHGLIQPLPPRSAGDSLEVQTVRKAFGVVNAMLTQVPGLADRLASTDSVGIAAQFMRTHPDIGGTEYVSSVAAATDNPRVVEALAASPAVMQPLLDRVCTGNASATMAMRALINQSTVREQLIVMGVVEALGRAVNSPQSDVVSVVFEAAATLLQSGPQGAHAVLGSSLVGCALTSLERGELRHPAGVLLEAAVLADPDVAEMAAAHDRLRVMLEQPHDSALLGALKGCLEASAGARTQLIESSGGQNLMLPLLQLAVKGSETVGAHAAGCAAALVQEPLISPCLAEMSVAQWVLELIFQGSAAVQRCALTVLLAVWAGGYAQASGPETFAGLVQGVGMLLESDDETVAAAALNLVQQASATPEYCAAFGSAGVAPAVVKLLTGQGKPQAVQVLAQMLRNPACSDQAAMALSANAPAVSACVQLAVHGGEDALGLGEARIVTVLLASCTRDAAWEAVLGTNYPNLLPLLKQAAAPGSLLEQRVATALGEAAAAPAPAAVPDPAAPVQPEYNAAPEAQPVHVLPAPAPYEAAPAPAQYQAAQPVHAPPAPAPYEAAPAPAQYQAAQPVYAPPAPAPYEAASAASAPAPDLPGYAPPTSSLPTASTNMFPTVPSHQPSSLPTTSTSLAAVAVAPTVRPVEPELSSSNNLDDASSLVRDLNSCELRASVAAATKLHKLYGSTLSGALDSAAILVAALDQCIRSPKPSTSWGPMLKLLGSASAATGVYAFPAARLNDGIAVVVSALAGQVPPSEDEIQAAMSLASVLPEGGLDTVEQLISQQLNPLAIRSLMSSEQPHLQHCGLRALARCSRPNWVQMSDVNRLMSLLASTDHNTVLAVMKAVLFASADARVGSIFLSKGANQKLLELVLHHPNPSVQAAAAEALPVLLQSSACSSLVELLQAEWHQIVGLLPASQSAAAAILSLLALLSPKDMVTARVLVCEAFPILLQHSLNEQSMHDNLAKAVSTAVYDTELRAMLESQGAVAACASELSAPEEGCEVSPACRSALEALIVFLSTCQSPESAALAVNQVVRPIVQLIASLAHVGCGGSTSRTAAASAAQLLSQALLVAPDAAVQQLMSHSAIPALVSMLQVPIPRDGSSCALRSTMATALCPLALHPDCREAVRVALCSGSEGFQGCSRAWDDEATVCALDQLKRLLYLE